MRYRRIRGDMIEVYKILHFENHPLRYLFNVDSNSNTRGHNFKLKKPSIKSSVRHHFFSFRVIERWNKLPFDVVNALSVENFKIKLDDYFEDILYEI